MQHNHAKLIFRIIGLLVLSSAGIALGRQISQIPAIPESITYLYHNSDRHCGRNSGFYFHAQSGAKTGKPTASRDTTGFIICYYFGNHRVICRFGFWRYSSISAVAIARTTRAISAFSDGCRLRVRGSGNNNFAS